MGQIEEWEVLSGRFSLLPLEGKKPVESNWTKWCLQKRPFHHEDFVGRNAGVACGPASGVIVLDIDNSEIFKELRTEYNWNIPETLIIKTGKGFHLYFEYKRNGKRYGCTSYKDPKGRLDETGKIITVFDVRGVGGQVVAQGSIHPETGKAYSVFRSVSISPCPQWLLDLCAEEEVPQHREPVRLASAWTGDIVDLPISQEVKDKILNGGDKGERSENIMSVVNALVFANLTDMQIQDVFENYAIGDKYREKGRGKTKWLGKHIQKARSYVTNRFDDEQTDYCYRSSSHVREKVSNNNNTVHTNCNQDAIEYEVASEKVDLSANPDPEPGKSCDDNRRRMTTPDDTVTTKRRQLETPSDISDILKESGVDGDDLTNVMDIVNKSAEREFDAPYLENLCRQVVVSLSSTVVTCRKTSSCRQMSSKLSDDVRSWVFSADGEFSINDIYKDLCVTSREVKKNTSKCLERLQEEGVIAKVGSRRGWFRLLDVSCDEIEFWREPHDSVNLLWPFGIEQLAILHPGSIVVIAGESNAGKTTFLLNLVAKNLWHPSHKFHFFTSESPEEMGPRLRDFGSLGIPITDWKRARDAGKFMMHNRDANFADVIKPGHGNINIIDFLQIHEDFFKIGKYFYDLQARLNGAVAVVAIQKNPGQSLGLGGARSIEKARIYVSIGKGWAQLMKIKHPVRPFPLGDHPDEFAIKFQFVAGCSYVVSGKWFKPKSIDDLKS